MMQSRVNRILWVEDDDQFVRDMQFAWRRLVSVRHVSNSEAALAALEGDLPELILLDLHLPHRLAQSDDDEGFALLAHIRSHFPSDLPVVVLTQDASPEASRLALALGANAYLRKPVAVNALEQVLGMLLRRAQDNPSSTRRSP